MQSGQERSRPLFDVTLFSKKFAELILCAFPANKLSFISFAAVSQVNSRQLISSTSTDFASCIFTTLSGLPPENENSVMETVTQNNGAINIYEKDGWLIVDVLMLSQ